MKTLLSIISIVTVSGYAAAQLVETAGVRVPAPINASNAITVLTFVMFALLLLADYGRNNRRSAQPARVDVMNTECRRVPVSGTRRNVYAIRRGSEAACLASPTNVVRFPARSRGCCDRAA